MVSLRSGWMTSLKFSGCSLLLCHGHSDSWLGTIQLTTERLHMKATRLIGHGNISTTQGFPVWKKKKGWGEKRPLCLFVFTLTGKYFLWTPYAQGFVIHNDGSCRNGGGGTEHPLRIQPGSKVCAAEFCWGWTLRLAAANGNGPEGPSQKLPTSSSILSIFCFFPTLLGTQKRAWFRRVGNPGRVSGGRGDGGRGGLSLRLCERTEFFVWSNTKCGRGTKVSGKD